MIRYLNKIRRILKSLVLYYWKSDGNICMTKWKIMESFWECDVLSLNENSVSCEAEFSFHIELTKNNIFRSAEPISLVELSPLKMNGCRSIQRTWLRIFFLSKFQKSRPWIGLKTSEKLKTLTKNQINSGRNKQKLGWKNFSLIVLIFK